MQDGAAVTGLAIAAASLVAVNTTGNAIYDPIGSIIVGNLLGMVYNISFCQFIQCALQFTHCICPNSFVQLKHSHSHVKFFYLNLMTSFWTVSYFTGLFQGHWTGLKLLLQVAIFLIQRNRHALIGRAMDDHDMQKVLYFLKNDPVQLTTLSISTLDFFLASRG